MVLTGHMIDFPLAELLFFLSSKQRSGWLDLRHSSMTITFTLRRGRLVAARSDRANERLGTRLVSEGLLTPTRLGHALAQQRVVGQHTPLGAVLVDLGYVDSDTIQRILREQIADCLLQVLIAPDGTFEFHLGAPEAEGVDLDVAIEREVLEAIRRADEWIFEQLQTSTVRLKPDLNVDLLESFVAEDWDIVGALTDDSGTVDEIAERTGRGFEETASALARLHSHGVIVIEGQVPASERSLVA